MSQLLRDEPQLLETSDRRLRERLVREVGERRTAPERERVAELHRGLRGVAALEVAIGLGHQPLEALQVELVRPDVDDVARRPGHDRLPACAERLAQLRDAYLERGRPGFRRLIAPELVDQAVAGDDLVRVQEEEREQGPLLRSTERHQATLRR